MTTPAHSSFDWVRSIDPNLKKLDSIPLTGAAPPFPWEDFSLRLAKVFDREDLSIKPGEIAWRSKETLYEGLGDAPYPLIFTIPSLRGQVCWVMPAQELDVLAALLLTQESHPLTFHDPDLTESFYRFLALEVLYQFTQTAFDQTLSPVLTSQTTLPNEDSLCKDLSISLRGQTIFGRLILSPEFRLSWVEHFAQKETPSELSHQLAELAEVIVHVEAGKCEMTLKEWNEIQLGDFILLDSCTLETERFHGRVILTINGKRAFRAKLKDGNLKILELPLLHEVDTPMAKKPEHEDEDDLSDLELPEESDQEEFEEEEEEEEESLFDDDLLSEESDTEETDTEAEETFPTEEAREEEVEEKKPAESPLFSAQQIPLNVIVEVGRIQMTVEQLMKLEPGNLLEIDIHPENGVHLTIQGRAVGKGELIRIGEAIGVRVLQLGQD